MRIQLSSCFVILFLLPLVCYGFSSVNPAVKIQNGALADFDYEQQDKIPWIQEGYNTYKWGDQEINYIEMGDPSKPALVLIHGFGASSYHWRYNIPVLARKYHVFAFCKLGFGLSSKPIQEYSADVWRDQTVAFLKDVVQKPATLAGNSLGGFTSLYTAATEESKSLVNGVVLLNGAGKFRDSQSDEEQKEPNPIVKAIQTGIQRFIIGASFVITKQPARIEQVLRQVYPNNEQNVDKELVESIRYPSEDPNASEVFYRVITKTGSASIYVDDLLDKMECPLLLCWGENDPWIRPQAADKVQKIYPKSQRVSINAGHCPHDEDPEAVNSAIIDFMEKEALRA